MQHKRLISMGLSLILAISAAACGGATGAISSDNRSAVAAADAETETSEVPETAASEVTGEVPGAAEAETETATSEVSAPALPQEEIPAEDISVKWADSRVYEELTLGQYDIIPTYEVKGYEEVPFIRATDYLYILFDGKERTSVENGVMTISVNDTTATLDPWNDTLQIEDPAKIRSVGRLPGAVDGAVIDEIEFNVITVSTKNESVQTPAEPLVISFADYHMPVIFYEGDILMPFLAYQNSFAGIQMMTHLAYNGRDYYNVFDANSYVLDVPETADSTYVKALYSGPFSTMNQTSQAYADYGYYSICLLLDQTFGHKEEKNITTFDDYFTRINAKGSMCSTDPTAAITAEILLFNYLFDSGHDSLASYKTVFGEYKIPDQSDVKEITDEIRESAEGAELFDEDAAINPDTETQIKDAIAGALLEKGFKMPEIAPLFIWAFFFSAIRPEDYGTQRLDYADDTAVIYFTSFKDDTAERQPSYYLEPITEEDLEWSSFAFFYSCFEDIKTHDEVKNVVLNISDNGGGAAAALVSILGFLSEDGEVRFTDMDLQAGSYREECYHVDTNLDGIADDQDGYGGQYNFYILCSGSSFSCGTALPYYAQRDGLAKIIGAKPGGGDCVVGSFVDAYGRCAFYSSMLKLGTYDGTTFTSDEKATTVDFDMMPSIWMLPVCRGMTRRALRKRFTSIKTERPSLNTRTSKRAKRFLNS